MRTVEVSRTLVKSPPEVWAELERVERLAELLGDDAVTITASKQETLIEWQGTAARGKIEIATSGWGTKVSLSAEVDELSAPADSQAAVERAPEAEVEPEPEAEVEPEPEAEVEPEPAPEPAPATTEQQLPTQTLWSRIKTIFSGPPPASQRPSAPTDVGENSAAQTTDLPEPVEPVAEPVEPEPVEPAPEPVAAVAEPTPEPDTSPADIEDQLTAVLDHLGSAHKRPFSSM